MYPTANKIKRAFQRPDSAKDYISYAKVKLDPREGLATMVVDAPPALKVRPIDYHLYDESTGVPNATSNVICGGTPIIVTEGGSDEGRQIGILMHDTEPGKKCQVAIEGLHLMMVDIETESGAITTFDPDELNGKIAYYNPDNGCVSDQDPGGFVAIGFFQGGRLDIKPGLEPISGYLYASVYIQVADSMLAAVALPSDAASVAPTEAIYAKAEISAFSGASPVGLTQILTVNFGNNNPNYEEAEHTIDWELEGTTFANAGREIQHTFTAGVGRTVSVTITSPSGESVTKDYTVTISATAAPASWTEV